MQHKAVYLLFCKYTLHVSGVYHTHHQLNKNKLQFCVLLMMGVVDTRNIYSEFISVFNQLDAQNLFHNKFYFMALHVSSTCARNM